jgi:hypothetical protein
MTTKELRGLCVDSQLFHLSTTRERIMHNLEALVGGLRSRQIPGFLWVDGSFMTEKIDPRDVDLVLQLDNEAWEKLSPGQQADVKWVEQNEEIRNEYDCDAQLLILFPHHHSNHWFGQYMYAYYLNLFGVGDFEYKGIALITL